MNPGIYQNASGMPEFAMNPSTTKYAEQMIGGQLSQERLMGMIGSKGGYEDKRVQHFTNMTADDIAAIEASQRRIAREEVERQIG